MMHFQKSKRILFLITLSMLLHNNQIRTEQCELNHHLQNLLGLFTGVAGIATITRGFFLTLDVPYPYSFNKNIIIAINKSQNEQTGMDKEKAYIKKGLLLTLCGALMVLGGWYILDSAHHCH